MGFLRVTNPTAAKRQAQHTLNTGCVLRSTGPSRIGLVV